MSIRVMSQVWAHSKMKGSALLLLLAIADHAHDDGTNAYPAVSVMAKKIRMSERQVQYLVRLLERSGELKTETGASPKGTNLYQVVIRVGVQSLHPDNASPVQSTSPGGVQSSVDRGAVQRREGVQRLLHPNQVRNHQEPSAGFSIPNGEAGAAMRAKAKADAARWLAAQPPLKAR